MLIVTYFLNQNGMNYLDYYKVLGVQDASITEIKKHTG